MFSLLIVLFEDYGEYSSARLTRQTNLFLMIESIAKLKWAVTIAFYQYRLASFDI